MPAHSSALVATPLAKRYIAQLCKHFAHHRPTRYTARWGRVELARGACTMEADAEILVLSAEAPDETALGEVERTMALHLARFAFRDPPEVSWRRAA